MKSISKWFKRSMRWSMALLLVAILGVGLTIAYFTDIEAAVNKFKIGKIDIETDEQAGQLTKTDIGVISNGSSECYIRMKVNVPTVSYRLNDGTESGAEITLVNGTVITVADWMTKAEVPAKVTFAEENPQTVNSVWQKKEDDYWYLSIPLNQGDRAQIIEKITYPGLWDEEKNTLVDPLPDGLTEEMLTIPIVSEAVQVDNIVVTGTGADAAYQAFQTAQGK